MAKVTKSFNLKKVPDSLFFHSLLISSISFVYTSALQDHETIELQFCLAGFLLFQVVKNPIQTGMGKEMEINAPVIEKFHGASFRH